MTFDRQKTCFRPLQKRPRKGGLELEDRTSRKGLESKVKLRQGILIAGVIHGVDWTACYTSRCLSAGQREGLDRGLRGHCSLLDCTKSAPIGQ